MQKTFPGDPRDTDNGLPLIRLDSEILPVKLLQGRRPLSA